MALTNYQLEQRILALNTAVNEIKEILATLQTKLNAKAVGLVIESKTEETETDIATLQSDLELLTSRVEVLENA